MNGPRRQIGPRGVVAVTGSEAAAYLQGQVSQDIDAIPDGGAAWSLVLDPTGKLVAWFRIWRLGDGFRLDVDPGVMTALVARLDRFKLRTDVEFAPETGWSMESALDGPGDGDGWVDFDWPGFPVGQRLIPSVTAPTVDDGYEEARIRAAVPVMGVDIDDETIPAEGGQPLIEMSVSFTKGCYTGQELVARIDSRGGNVPRPLRVLESADGSALAVGATVVFDGQEIGTTTSAAGSVALGRILRKAEIGSAVEVGGVAATVIAPTGSA